MTGDIKCPLCGSATNLRTAKKGSSAGEEFYVCERYPACKGKIKYQPLVSDRDRSKLEKMMGSMTSDAQLLATFECIRSQASPIMSKVSKASGGREKDFLEALHEATRHLPILLRAMKEVPEPSKEEYKRSRADVLQGIDYYIQGCQSHIKWVETRNTSYLDEGLAHFNAATRKFDSSANWLVKSE